MIKINVMYYFLRNFPQIKRWLKMAKMRESPEEFVKKTFILSVYVGATLLIISFFFISKFHGSFMALPIIFLLGWILSFLFFLQAPRVEIRKREREINKEVLFAGRYLLVKLQAGAPLFNSLIDASKGYGICSKYFKEIVDDINMGTPIEKALEVAREYNCSEKFQLILAELVTTLKTGADVTLSLNNVLQQITSEQVIEIKEYGKKLNAFMLIYLILAIVLPSLGMTMFIAISGFINVQVNSTLIFLSLIFISLIQYTFLSMFKSIRPMVNL